MKKLGFDESPKKIIDCYTISEQIIQRITIIGANVFKCLPPTAEYVAWQMAGEIEMAGEKLPFLIVYKTENTGNTTSLASSYTLQISHNRCGVSLEVQHTADGEFIVEGYDPFGYSEMLLKTTSDRTEWRDGGLALESIGGIQNGLLSIEQNLSQNE